MKHLLECPSEDAYPPGLALVQGATERRDELLDLFKDVLCNWHIFPSAMVLYRYCVRLGNEMAVVIIQRKGNIYGLEHDSRCKSDDINIFPRLWTLLNVMGAPCAAPCPCP
jgi:hypothetical protein